MEREGVANRRGSGRLALILGSESSSRDYAGAASLLHDGTLRGDCAKHHPPPRSTVVSICRLLFVVGVANPHIPRATFDTARARSHEGSANMHAPSTGAVAVQTNRDEVMKAASWPTRRESKRRGADRPPASVRLSLSPSRRSGCISLVAAETDGICCWIDGELPP